MHIYLHFRNNSGWLQVHHLDQNSRGIIRTTNSFLDVEKWRTKLGQVEAQVCRIEIQSNMGVIYGTGFLLAPSVIITNYHVMEAVIEGEEGRTTSKGMSAMSGDVILRIRLQTVSRWYNS